MEILIDHQNYICIKCKNSRIAIKRHLINYTSYVIIDKKQQLVAFQNNRCDLNMYNINNGEIKYLCRVDNIYNYFFNGFAFCHKKNEIHIYKFNEKSLNFRLIDILKFNDDVLYSSADDDYLIIMIRESKSILYNYKTKKQYKFNFIVYNTPYNGIISVSGNEDCYLNINDIIEHKIMTREQCLKYALEINKYKEETDIIPFSKDYVEKIKSDLLSINLPSALIDNIIAPLLGL